MPFGYDLGGNDNGVPKNISVKQQALMAYADANDEYPDNKRDLDWIASESVTVDYARDVMNEALSGRGYNFFEPNALLLIPKFFVGTPKVTLSRQLSVGIFVHGRPKKSVTEREIQQEMKADEFWKIDKERIRIDPNRYPKRLHGTYRIWWD